MSFDWKTFRTIADELIKSQNKQGIEEAYYRSAVSRLYYSAFHSVKNILEQAGVTIPNTRMHESVRERCESSNNQTYRIIGTNLHRLFNFRIDADYKAKRTVNLTTALSSSSIANTIFSSISKIDPVKNRP